MSFNDYLRDIGINVSLFKKDGNQIFELSDYLRNLTASDAFDLSVKIHEKWANKQNQRKRPSKLITLLDRAFKNTLFKSLQRIKSTTLSIKNIQSPLKAQGLSQTCERLYLEGLAHKVKKEQYQELHVKQELQNCTFKPQISCDSVIKTDNSVFDRLYKTQLSSKYDYSEIKESNEMKGCTFTPQIPNTSYNILQNSHVSSQSGIFDRLYKESEFRNQTKEMYTPIKQQQELQGCTFKPAISNLAQSLSRDKSPEIFDRLHQESAEKLSIRAFQKMDKDHRELQECSFKPAINNTSCNTPSSVSAHERLYQLSNKKSYEPYEKQLKQISKQSFQKDDGTLYERMKQYVNQKKRKIDQIKKEISIECTFKPKINSRQQISPQLTRTESRNNISSQQSNQSEKKFHLKNQMSTYLLNTRKSQQHSDKENSLSMYCETAYFQEDTNKNIQQKKFGF